MKKWILPALLSFVLTGVIFAWSLFYNWGIPYFTAHFTFGGMVVPFILFFFFALVGIRFIILAVQKAKANRKRLAAMSPEEREAEQQRKQAVREANWQQQAAQITEQKRDTTPRCPKCGSTSITANQKGFGIGKAVVGATLAGPFGLVAGNAGAKKVFITCLNCGHRWQAGKK